MPILGVSSSFISKWKKEVEKVFFQNGSPVMLEIAKRLERFQQILATSYKTAVTEPLELSS